MTLKFIGFFSPAGLLKTHFIFFRLLYVLISSLVFCLVEPRISLEFVLVLYEVKIQEGFFWGGGSKFF